MHRDTNAAKGLYRSLLVAVLDHGKIQTTLSRAKAVQGDLDRLINWAKEGSVNARRLTVEDLGTDKFFDKYTKAFTTRTSGYSRIVRLGQRMSDAAELAILELVESVEPKKEAAISESKAQEPKAETKTETKKPAVKKSKTLKK